MDTRNLITTILSVSLLFVAVTHGSEEFNFDGKFYLLDNMEEINPDLKWDESGVLEDIADRFATCDSLEKKGMIDVGDKTPEGLSVKVFVDAGKGWMTDMHSVQMYVRHVVLRWVANTTYVEQFRKSEGVSCKMQPGCDGFTVVSCAFSYRVANKLEGNNGNNNNMGSNPTPKAFTRAQYREVEKLTGKDWDRSHFLENLAGFDAKCSMTGDNSFNFKETKSYAERWNVKVGMEYGTAEDKESTDNAVMEIIKNLHKDTSGYTKIGCCLIPDCASTTGIGQYRVVVVCLYS